MYVGVNIKMVFVEGFDFVFDEVNFKFDYSFDFDDEKKFVLVVNILKRKIK